VEGSGLFWKITMAAVMLFMVIRLWPAAKHWAENGPKGSSNDWLVAALVLGAVVGFVALLIAVN